MKRRSEPLSRVLSDWEVLEAYQEHERGIQMDVLAARYKLSERSLSRAFKRVKERGLA